MEIVTETARKWFAGETKPRPQALRQLAEIVGVDEAWLALGSAPYQTQKPVQPGTRPHPGSQNASASGAVNLVAGLVQLDGGAIAFPEPNDRRADVDILHMYAIIRGVHFPLHVVTGERADGDGWRFSVPLVARDAVVLGVMRVEPFGFRIVELDTEGLGSVGTRKDGFIEIEMDKDRRSGAHSWTEVRSFTKRL